MPSEDVVHLAVKNTSTGGAFGGEKHYHFNGGLPSCQNTEDHDVTRGRRGWSPPAKFFAPLEKCVVHSWKLLDIFEKTWAPVRKLFANPGVSSWLRACWRLERLQVVVKSDLKCSKNIEIIIWLTRIRQVARQPGSARNDRQTNHPNTQDERQEGKHQLPRHFPP